jgi:hypothetical protein
MFYGHPWDRFKKRIHSDDEAKKEVAIDPYFRHNFIIYCTDMLLEISTVVKWCRALEL